MRLVEASVKTRRPHQVGSVLTPGFILAMSATLITTCACLAVVARHTHKNAGCARAQGDLPELRPVSLADVVPQRHNQVVVMHLARRALRRHMYLYPVFISVIRLRATRRCVLHGV